MKSIHIFIISWIGQHENAAAIRRALGSHFENVTIVYSDPDASVSFDTGFDQIRRPSDLYWSDKFETCIDTCQSELMLIIHADCKTHDWLALCQRCCRIMTDNNFIAVWSPRIDGTYFDLAKTKIATIDNSRLSIAAQTDGMVFAVTRPVLQRMRRADYTKNIYGWGINWMICCCAFTMNKLVVIDETFTVVHPQGRGYDSDEAMRMKTEFLKQLTMTEVIQYRLLSGHIRANGNSPTRNQLSRTMQ